MQKIRPLLHVPFSPYSRGWSQLLILIGNSGLILPVFAGMVRNSGKREVAFYNSPRIRGDGPGVTAILDMHR